MTNIELFVVLGYGASIVVAYFKGWPMPAPQFGVGEELKVFRKVYLGVGIIFILVSSFKLIF